MPKIKPQIPGRSSDIADGVEGVSANVLQSSNIAKIKLKLGNAANAQTKAVDTKAISKYEDQIKELENIRTSENQ